MAPHPEGQGHAGGGGLESAEAGHPCCARRPCKRSEAGEHPGGCQRTQCVLRRWPLADSWLSRTWTQSAALSQFCAQKSVQKEYDGPAVDVWDPAVILYFMVLPIGWEHHFAAEEAGPACEGRRSHSCSHQSTKPPRTLTQKPVVDQIMGTHG